MVRHNDHQGSRHGQEGRAHLAEDRVDRHDLGEGSGIVRENHSSLSEEAFYDDSRALDEGCNHGVGAHRDVRRNIRRRQEDSHRIHDGVESANVGRRNDHRQNEGHALVAKSCKKYDRQENVGQAHTSEMQRTLEPLNSELSSFSTATFKSSGDSNSTKLNQR